MKIAFHLETAPGEQRVALTPDSVARLVKGGHEVRIQAGAGTRAGFPDSAYEAAGARSCRRRRPVHGRRPRRVACSRRRRPRSRSCRTGVDAARRCSRPRATRPCSPSSPRGASPRSPSSWCRASRAPSRWTCSRRRHRRRLQGGADRRRRAAASSCPMLTTAAGNVSPAKVFVIGAGVAGLQAIATARRLGGGRLGVRRAARGARAGAEPRRDASSRPSSSARRRRAAGGYARAQTADEQQRTREALAAATCPTWISSSPRRRSPAGRRRG